MLGLDAYGSSSDDDDTVVDPPSARAEAIQAETTRKPSASPSKPLFGNLPRPGVAKRVVTIPAPALRAALDDDSESDSEDGRAVKRARAAESVRGRGGSLAEALPRPKLAGSMGSGRGAALDLGRPSANVNRARVDAVEANEAAAAEDLSDEEAGPHAADL